MGDAFNDVIAGFGSLSTGLSTGLAVAFEMKPGSARNLRDHARPPTPATNHCESLERVSHKRG